MVQLFLDRGWESSNSHLTFQNPLPAAHHPLTTIFRHTADLEGEANGGHPNGGANGVGGTNGDAAHPRLRYETVYTGPALSCDVRNLEPASSYSLRVRAHNTMGGSAWGEAVTVTTAAAAPGPPSAVAVAPAKSSGQLCVSWSPPLHDHGAPVSGYLVEMTQATRKGGGGGGAAAGGGGGKGGAGAGKAASAAAAWRRMWQGPETSYTATDLLPGRRYQFRVRASSAQGLGPWCEVAEGATLAAVPSAPGRPTVTQRSATSLKVRLALPADDHGASVSGFVLQARRHDPNSPRGAAAYADVYTGLELSARVTGLEPGTSYDLRAAARNAVGLGPWSDAEVATTTLRAPAPPSSLSAEVEEGPPAVVHVTWAAPVDPDPAAAEAVGYEVELLPVGSSAAIGSASSGAHRQQVGRVETASLQGVAGGCTYNAHVRSVGAAGSGHSQWSESVRVTVPVSAATAPSDVAEDNGGGSQLGAGDDAGAGGRGGF
jgi:hypothetical protein